MAMVIKGSANNYCRQMRNWESNTLALAKKEYDELEEIMSHLKQSENWEWHLEHVIPNHYLRPGEVCEKVYDYVIQDGRLVKTGYVNYNPMYRKEKVIDYNADAGDWGDYDDNWYDWYDQPEYRNA